MLLAYLDGDATDVLALARSLVGPGEALDVAVVGDAGDVGAEPGIARVHVIDHRLLDEYSPEPWGEALGQLVGQLRPAAVIGPGTDRGGEVMAQAAARLRLPLATQCVSVTPGPAADDAWALTRVRAGGSLLEDAELDAEVKLVTVAPGAVVAGDGGAGAAPEVMRFTPVLDDAMARSRLVERTSRADGVALATARVVVSGGRGVGSAEGFATLEELAGLLGAAVGCSRVATNNGWRPHTDQVGQTGTKVAPDLYLACGISGATQHWVGCMNAKTILAINTDADAPLVTRATYAVIGDVHEVLPAVIAEIRSRAGGRVDDRGLAQHRPVG